MKLIVRENISEKLPVPADNILQFYFLGKLWLGSSWMINFKEDPEATFFRIEYLKIFITPCGSFDPNSVYWINYDT